jgi:hypothetical protein
MRIFKFLLFFILCFPSYAGIKAVRSATNPATYVDADGVIQLLTLSNTVRPKHYYDTTGFHQLAGWMKEVSSTNYVLNSYFSLDTDADGLSDDWSSYTSAIKTRETCSINGILNGKSQKASNVITSEVTRYVRALKFVSAIDSFDASAGSFDVIVSFYARGDVSGLVTGLSLNNWFSILAVTNDETFVSSAILRRINQAVSDGLHATNWNRFIFKFNISNTTIRRLEFNLFYFAAENGSRPTTGESFWIETYGVQIEKQSAATSYIPTTTTPVTRNAESYRCRKYLD